MEMHVIDLTLTQVLTTADVFIALHIQFRRDVIVLKFLIYFQQFGEKQFGFRGSKAKWMLW